MKISIITTAYNSERTIEDTIKSVLGQSYLSVEYIIVNDGSSDATLDIVNKYQGKIAQVVSGSNTGMYSAMNKGIKLASGDIVGILNSDDFYASSDVLQKVAQVFETEKVDCVWGDLIYFKDQNPSKPWRTWKSSPYQIGAFEKGWHPPHPTFFVRREVYEKYGLFRTDLSTAGDFELMLRFLEKNKISSAYLPEVLVKMRTGGLSNKSIYNRLRAIWYSYKAFKLNNLKVSPLFLFRKPLAKLHQFN